MKLEHFADLISRQKVRELVVTLYDNTRNCKYYGLKDRICADAELALSLIARGFATGQNASIKDNFIQAKGLLVSVESASLLLLDLGAINIDEQRNIQNIVAHANKMLGAFIKSIIAQ